MGSRKRYVENDLASKQTTVMNELNKYSKQATQNDTQHAAQAILHAISLTREDLLEPQTGIVSAGWEGKPCNMHLSSFATVVKKSSNAQVMIGLLSHTAGVSGAISMGSSGMRYSLPSREV